MIQNLPIYISISFIITSIVTLLLFYWVIKNSNSENVRKKSRIILLGLTIWLLIQGILSLKNVYSFNINSMPPKIILFGIAPTILTLLLLFLSKKGRIFIDSLEVAKLTLINTVRIPVEIILYLLFINSVIPKLMTFEGRNFDLLAGISAPIIYYGLRKSKLNSKVILIWNFVSLGLLLNIVINALFSAPSPFQKFAFDQPNIAILHFPFSFLPTFIVPVVLFGHLISIRKLIKIDLNNN
ncbi:hypothetical protein [Flavobacterium sp.]|uniref:hypothetical protein n=1 Tax=Flavobacterium sp. TaxID=239 RepID=UPI00261ACC12|nr:hypothetical protein [Flavobacterium sp.]